MLKSEAVQHYGSLRAVADAAEVSPSAVSQWDELVPPLSAAKLSKHSNGALVFDPDVYKDWNRPRKAS